MNKITISKRGQTAPPSPIRMLVPLAEEAKKRGVKVYHLNIGQPDLLAPEGVAKKILSCREKYLPYENSQGSSELIKSFQYYYNKINIHFNYEELLITSGASEALIFILAAICDPGDEVIVFEPFYANYLSFANLLNIKIVPVPLNAQKDYHLPKDQDIKSKINKNTKAIIVNNPNNPTGTVLTEKEISRICDLALTSNLFIISDEAYYGLSFGKNKCLSIYHVAHKNLHQNIILVDSLSKKLNVCGARIGIIASKNMEIMKAVNRFAQARLSVSTLDQSFISNAVKNMSRYVGKLAHEYQKRRDVFIETFKTESNLKIHQPEGAFYVLIKLPIKDSDKFAEWLLTDFSNNGETVMVAPGSGFYATENSGKDEIRIAFVLKLKDLKRAAKLLAMAVKTYVSKNS